MFEVDTRELQRVERDLEAFAEKALPFAVRNSLNASAFEARKLWQAEIRSDFTLRNRYTERSIRVEKVRTLQVRRMEAIVGSVADYMETQEHGGTERKAVPTEVAAGQAMGSQPRIRTVRGANKMTAIRLTDRNRTADRRVRNRIAIRKALKSGTKFVLLELDRGPGIFKLTGGSRRLQVRMVWDLRKTAHHIPPTPTLGPALAKLHRQLPRIHRDALLEQLRRHRVFGY